MNSKESANLARKHFERAEQARLAGRLGYALRDYRRAIALHPTPERYTALARSLAALGRYDRAIDRCQAAIGLDPDFAPAYRELALVLIQQEQWEEAQPWLELALSAPADAARAETLFQLGRCHQQVGRYREACHCYQQALQEDVTLEAAAEALVLVTRMMN